MMDLSQATQSHTQFTSAVNSASEAITSVDTRELNDDILAIQSAKLEDVTNLANAQKENMILALSDLDETISSLSNMDGIRHYTGLEKVVKVFNQKKAAAMRMERIRSASFDEVIQDLVLQSQNIVSIMENEEQVLTDQEKIISAKLEETLIENKKAAEVLKELKGKIEALKPTILEAQDKIAACVDADSQAERTQLEEDLKKLTDELAELEREQTIQSAKSQSLEKYAKINETYLSSLQSQLTNQKTMIQKLELDTSQRIKQFSALADSIKVSEQQRAAHDLDHIGNDFDDKGQQLMANMGAASDNRMMDMLESFDARFAKAEQISDAQKRFDENYKQQFGDVLERLQSRDFKKS
ncbi:hypothetical protein [Neptuniibacter sp. QD37_11]|uniref:hypothetical protein n=1 Tax=Neptuniibacter sp. QD37_11 TaxID=3398209 RepID=UPI0039F59560